MRPATIQNSTWSLQRVKRLATNSGGARRWLLYTIIFVLLCYLAAATWFAFRLLSPAPNKRTIVHLRDEKEDQLPPFNEDDIHIVFSTGCNLFQHWQAEVLLYSHQKVGQRGKITRVVSGCDTEAQKREHAKFLTHPEGLGDEPVSLQELEKSSNDRFKLHVTPSFPGAREFPWINKPMGLAHWLDNANPTESVIVVIDPDQFFMDKLRIDGKRKVGSGVLCTLDCKNGATDQVLENKPVAQQYGLGGGFVHKHNVRAIVGDDSPATLLTEEEAAKHYSVGPPMMLHIRDFKRIMPYWVKYMRPVFEGDPGDIQADMYAYSLAAAHNKLPHMTYDHYMVSSPETEGEAWPYVDRFDMSKMLCSNPNQAVREPDSYIPTFIHVAQRYDSDLTPFMFHKGHVIANLLTCDLPLLVQPPEDLIQQAPKHNKHHMYMLCNAYQLINEAALAWKQKFCGGKYNSNKAVMLQKHAQQCSKQDQGNKCWIFARVIDSLNS